MTNEPEKFDQEAPLPYEIALSNISTISELRANFDLKEGEILKAIPELAIKGGNADLYHFVRVGKSPDDLIIKVRVAKGEDGEMEYWDLSINLSTKGIEHTEHCTGDGALFAEVTLDPDVQEENTVGQTAKGVKAKANETLRPESFAPDADAENVEDPQDSLDTVIPRDLPVRQLHENGHEAHF